MGLRPAIFASRWRPYLAFSTLLVLVLTGGVTCTMMEPAKDRSVIQELRSPGTEVQQLIELLDSAFMRSLFDPEDKETQDKAKIRAERACLIVARLEQGELELLHSNFQGSASLESPFFLMSSTKSVVSLLFGMLEERGIISKNDSVAAHIPELSNSPLAEITMQQLLTHRAGFDFKEGSEAVSTASSQLEYFLSVEALDHPVGGKAIYSNEGVQLLTFSMERALGKASPDTSLQDFAREELFSALDMHEDTKFNSYRDGIVGTGDLKCSPQDFLKIGTLLLKSGRYKDKQIIAEAYIQEATKPHFDVVMSQGGSARGCGYYFWEVPGAAGAFATIGFLNNNMYLLPESGLIVFRGHNAGDPPQETIDAHTSIDKETQAKSVDGYAVWKEHDFPILKAAESFEFEALPIIARMAKRP